MLDKQKENVKMIDFGFSSKYSKDDLLQERMGSQMYMAPEIQLKQPYDGQAADVFALGVILFTMIVGHEPFPNTKPEKTNITWRCIAENKPHLFWNFHCKSKNTGHITLSDDIMDLIEKMMTPNPSDRIKIQSIFAHPWIMTFPDKKKEDIKDEHFWKNTCNFYL